MRRDQSLYDRHGIHRGTTGLRPALLGLALVVFFVQVPLSALLAIDGALYLTGTGVPQANLSMGSVGNGALPNYDAGRDDDPGLTLKKTNKGVGETDPSKYQIWIGPSTGLDLDGQASLTFWSAMKDFDESKDGEVEAYLLDCATSGDDCKVIDSGSIRLERWSAGSSGWVSRTINFGSVSHSFAPGRSLAVKAVVANDSGDDMWFAYGVATYPSALAVTLASPATTTTTSTTTTTTTPPSTTTTTTTPPSTTTTTTTPPSTTTTTTTPPSTTTTKPSTTTTTTATVAPSTTTTTTTTPTAGSEGSGDDSLSQDPSDVTLAALPDPEQLATSGAEISSGITEGLFEGLDLVLSPPIATALLSPLLVFSALAQALTDSGKALLLPGFMLLVGFLYLSNEAKVKAALTWSNDPERQDQ